MRVARPPPVFSYRIGLDQSDDLKLTAKGAATVKAADKPASTVKPVKAAKVAAAPVKPASKPRKPA
jgi:hypothetical protein